MKKSKDKFRFLATRNQRLKALQTCPQLLAEDLLMVFGLIRTDEDKGVHNHIVKKIVEMCPNLDSMLLNVSNAIIRTVKETD